MSTSASIGVRQSMYSWRSPEWRSFVSAMLNDAPNKPAVAVEADELARVVQPDERVARRVAGELCF